MAGHLLDACLQYGQVLASAVSRLVSAAAATIFPPSTPLISPSLPPDRCSHTTTASQLFMGPACFDFKYLPRRRLFWSGEWGGGEEEEQSRLETHIHVLCVSLCMYTHTHLYGQRLRTGLSCFYLSRMKTLTSSREKENSLPTGLWPC